MERVLFLTGHLAEPSLRRVLEGMAASQALPFTWTIQDLGVQVAALMTADMIQRRLPAPVAADRIIVPGRARGDMAALSAHYGIPVERGPEELKDLPRHFNRRAAQIDLSRHDTLIFAEIVDAPRLTVEQVVERAAWLRGEGADVIDIGCLPETAFDHLEDCVRALKAAGHRVSVDSLNTDELRRGGRAGADHILSLTVDTLWVADALPHIVPVLIGRSPSDEDSLDAAIAGMRERGREFYADPILDPIPFGFVSSIGRYERLARRHPDVNILMGVGNLTELTEADTSGINALLFGMVAELGVKAVLATQVSSHCRRAIREADVARRIMHAAATERCLPKGLSDALMTTHAKHPHPDTAEEIAALAAQVRDPNFRVQVSEAGIHVYNRDGHQVVRDPFTAWPGLQLMDDASHAFYMGVELARAEIAFQLGKRHVQDRPLEWGVAAQVQADDDACAPASGSSSKPPSTRPASRRDKTP